MTAETSNSRGEISTVNAHPDRMVSLLQRVVPFLQDEGAKYDDDGSNEPLELAREIEAELDAAAEAQPVGMGPIARSLLPPRRPPSAPVGVERPLADVQEIVRKDDAAWALAARAEAADAVRDESDDNQWWTLRIEQFKALTQQPAAHPDDAAVDSFAGAMKEKLAAARAKGRGGWDGDEPGMQQRLSDMLRDHVMKGDPRDVANFAMFLHQRGESILPTQQPAAVDEALWQAARSLRTIADQAGKTEGMEDMQAVRGYANSRATVAEAALAGQQGGEP